MADDSSLNNIAMIISLDINALTMEWRLFINDHTVDSFEPYKFLKQLAETKGASVIY